MANLLDGADPRHADLAHRLDRHWRRTELYDGGERLDAAGLDFSGLVLDGARLAEGRVVECTFEGASLRGADLYYLAMSRCSFRGADLRAAWLYKGEAFRCDFRDAVLTDAFFGRLDALHCDFRGANMGGAHLRDFGWIDSDLREADLSGAWLDWTSFGGCLLAGTNFDGATGTVVRTPRLVNVGSREKPKLLQGEHFLDWLRAAGARNVSYYVPPRPVPRDR